MSDARGPTGPPADARRAALHVLTHPARRRGRFVADLLDELLAASSLAAADRHLAGELVLGTVRHQLTLDAVIAAFLKRPDQRLDAVVREVLRMATYQLLFLDRVPAYAAVKAAVDLAAERGGRPAGGFANAVLRGIDRSRTFAEDPPEHPPDGVWIREGRWACFDRPVLPKTHPLPQHLAAAYSHPPWLISRWIARFGQERTVELLRTGNGRPHVTVRPIRLRTSSDSLRKELEAAGFAVRPDEATGALQLDAAGGLAALAALAEGRCHVMDLAAMAPAAMLAPRPGSRVLDLCAAPGGKTIQLADAMEDRGVIVACDVAKDKLDQLSGNVARAHLACVQVRPAEAAPTLAAEEGMFDFALVDAPCSNTGVLARRVDVRYRLREADLVALAKVQLDVLTTAAGLLAPGGAMVYSTCSLEPEENGHLVRHFLRIRKDFRLDAEQETLPAAIPLWRDGGYAARLVRVS